MKVFPEIDEDRFQSLVAVPIPARSGESIGVVVLHTQAPREFDEDDLNFLVHTASLVAGAIENAQLYEDTRRRVDALTTLSALGQEIAAVTGREALYAVVTEGVRALLDCDVCQLYLVDPAAGGRLELAAADPPDGPSPWPDGEGTKVLLDVLRQRRLAAGPAVLAAPVAAGAEHLGVLAVTGARPFRDDEDELLRLVANQAAVALKRTELIERLTEENLVRDLFEALASGATDVAEARARAVGCDLDRPHVFVHGEAPRAGAERRPWPAVAERTEHRLRRLAPGVVCDSGPETLRALLPLRSTEPADVAALEQSLDALGGAEHVLLGFSAVRQGAENGSRSLREAADAFRTAQALQRTGGAMAYERLGAYKYLVRLPLDDALDDRHGEAIQRLVDYDRRRRTQLIETLEQFLRDRRSIATTARALYIHPNTLRQRLDRIEQISGLSLADEDLLSLELAIKLVRLRTAPQRP
jgi:GAF domain-containing protein